MDYIYYRMLCWYKQKKDCATYTSIMFITMVKIFIWFPLVGFIGSLFRTDNIKTDLYLYCIFCITMLLHSATKYTKQKEKLSAKYKHSKYNKLIPNWMIFCSLPLSLLLGVAIYIILCTKVINYYGLEGAIPQLLNK